MTHTPTPQDCIYWLNGFKSMCPKSTWETHAAYIVKAVNGYEQLIKERDTYAELVESLKNLFYYCRPEIPFEEGSVMMKARTVLDKVGAIGVK